MVWIVAWEQWYINRYGDKDVDGSDLAEYLFDSGGIGLNAFAASFGIESCP